MNLMSILRRGWKLALAPLALATLAACASHFNADVSRFETQLPAPAGQTFTVVADDPAMAGGIEFGLYAQQVADHMATLGYHPVNDPAVADMIVHFGYGVDGGRERVRSTGFADPWWGPWYGYGYRPYYATPYYGGYYNRGYSNYGYYPRYYGGRYGRW